jgi:YVTN family beta-propeller protein
MAEPSRTLGTDSGVNQKRGRQVSSLRRVRPGRGWAGCAALLLLALSACRRHDFPQYPPNYREYAYVTNGASNTVTILDVVNVRLDRELQVGTNPLAVAPSPTRNEVYVLSSGTATSGGSVAVIGDKNSVTAQIPVNLRPVSIDVDAEGKLAYVANSGSNTVSVIDLEARRQIAQIGTGEEPMDARITPDGKTLIVANRLGNAVTVIDAAARRVRAVFEGCPGALDIAILPDSSKGFVACSGGHQVMAIALARPDAHPPVPTDRLEALLDVGRNPLQLALKPDGGELFVSNSQSNSISEIVTTTNDVGGAYIMGDNPVHGLVSSDNSLLYVANLRSQEVTIYSIDDGKRAGAIHVGDGPSAMAFSDAGHLLFVVDARSADVAVVRTASRALFTMLPAGRGPNAIAIKSFRVQ